MLDLTAWDDGFDALSRHLPYDCFVWPGVVLLEEDASLMAVVEYRGRDQDGMEPAELIQTTGAVANVLFPFTGGWTFHFELQKRLAGGYPRSTGAHPVPELIDAAHIVPDADETLGQPLVQNGICMSKLHHTAFDLGLLAIDQDYTVHVAKRVVAIDDGPMIEHLRAIDGRPMRRPENPALWPDRDRLRQRYRETVATW